MGDVRCITLSAFRKQITYTYDGQQHQLATYNRYVLSGMKEENTQLTLEEENEALGAKLAECEDSLSRGEDHLGGSTAAAAEETWTFDNDEWFTL